MVKKHILDIITSSGVRKELLLYLYDGSKTFTEIREHLDLTAPEVSPRIKELIEHDLITAEAKTYSLTPMGKAIMDNYLPLLNTIKTFEKHFDYWISHDLESIPPEFLLRIGEIGNAEYIEDNAENASRTRIELSNILSNSQYAFGVSNIFDDAFPDVTFNFIKSKKQISFITTPKIIGIFKIRQLPTFIKYSTYSNLSLYIINDDLKTSFIVTDKYLYLSINYKNGKFDTQSNLISEDKLALKWGMDLFEYYKSRSVKLK